MLTSPVAVITMQHTSMTADEISSSCRIEGLFKEAMTAALRLPLHRECSTAMAFAAMLLSFASGDVANRSLLATTEAVQLASQLLQVIYGSLYGIA